MKIFQQNLISKEWQMNQIPLLIGFLYIQPVVVWDFRTINRRNVGTILRFPDLRNIQPKAGAFWHARGVGICRFKKKSLTYSVHQNTFKQICKSI